VSKVFVLDANKQPLPPVHPGRARVLLTQSKAAVFRRYPFTIILKSVPLSPEVHPLRLKIDPGSKTTGIALVNETTGAVVFAAELLHRAEAIKKALDQRRPFVEDADSAKPATESPGTPIGDGTKGGWLPLWKAEW